MIAYLNGTIKKKLEKTIILDTGNIGYLVHLPAPLIEGLKEKEHTELFIYTKVREDDISLFGFATLEDLDFFKLLLNVNGIGPKLAIEVLSQNTDKIRTAIFSSDLTVLCKIPGIGKKTAERIIIELKSKVTPGDLTRAHQTIENKPNDEAVNAIMSLGYQKYEIQRVLNNVPDDIKSTEEIITYFLRNV